MRVRIEIIAAAILIIVLGVLVGAFLLRSDQYHTPERRAAKNRMIAEIEGQVLAAAPEDGLADDVWWNDEMMRFADGSWIAYRARCHKKDPKVYDLFIGLGSDGQWYHSTFHFCVGMMVLHNEPQPESLDVFVSEYALRKFDGSSDDALLPTWP